MRIVYEDFSPTAAADAEYSATQASAFSTLEMGLPAPYVTLEMNRWLLDGSVGQRNGNSVTYWSDTASDEDGYFDNPPTITINFSAAHSSTGISITFDTTANEFCSEIEIVWMHGSTILETETFYPNSAVYFCEMPVETFDKIIIYFIRTSVPGRRVRVESIDYGRSREYRPNEIQSATVITGLNLLSAELPAGQVDITLNTAENTNFLFQKKQPIKVYADNIIGTYYLDEGARIGARAYTITALDPVGVLISQAVDEGRYLSGVSAMSLFTSIVDGEFPIEYRVADTTLYGILEAQSKRDALQQVLFAWGCCCRCEQEKLVVFQPDYSDPVVIPANKTFIGGSVKTRPIVTQVIVTAHTYTVSSGEIKDTPVIYVADNPLATADDAANIIEVTGTLVSTYNGAQVAQRVLDYYNLRNTHTAKVIYNGEMVGDCIERTTPWGSSQIGNIQNITISLSGLTVATIDDLGVNA